MKDLNTTEVLFIWVLWLVWYEHADLGQSTEN